MKIRVLIVDDSSLIRALLKRVLETDPGIEVVGQAPDPYIAREKLVELKPDVMTLDVEMPKMDGITFLEKVMQHFPTPTIVVSSLTTEGAVTTLKALELGAVDVAAKPAMSETGGLEQMGRELILKVKAAAKARIPKRSLFQVVQPVETRVAQASRVSGNPRQMLAIASSTGGTEALKHVLTRLPADLPGTVIVQHMPSGFTQKYAESLQRICSFEVREARDGDRICQGRVLLAPGDFHMEVAKIGSTFHVRLNRSPMIHGVRPAADILMESVAKVSAADAIGVVLTGMGKDGAKGLLAMRKAGSFNIAQDEASCIVFGMPKEAIQIGAIDQVLPLDEIAEAVMNQVNFRNAPEMKTTRSG